MRPACKKLRHMSQTSFLFAASCGSLLSSNWRCACGEIATTGSAAFAMVVAARKATAPTSSLMGELLTLLVGCETERSAIVLRACACDAFVVANCVHLSLDGDALSLLLNGQRSL